MYLGGGTESRYTDAGDLYVSGRGDRVKIYWCWRPLCIWEGGQSQDILVLETFMYLGGGTESRYTGAGDLYVSGRGDRVKIYWCWRPVCIWEGGQSQDILVLETCMYLGGGTESRYTGVGDLYVSGRGDRVKIYWCWRPVCIWEDRVKIYWCWRPVCIWEGGQSQDILVLETCMYLGGGTESRYTGAGDLYVSGRGDRVKIYWC